MLYSDEILRLNCEIDFFLNLMGIVSTKGIHHRVQHLNLIGIWHKIGFGKPSFSHCIFARTFLLNFRNTNLEFYKENDRNISAKCWDVFI